MSLTTQTIRRLLRLTIVTMLMVSGFLAWRAVVRPSVATLASNGIAVASPRSVTQPRRSRELEEFAPLLTRSLSAPLYDVPSKTEFQPDDLASESDVRATDEPPESASPEPSAAPSRKKPRPQSTGLRLMGTMIEDGRSIAILADVRGGVQLAKVGDSINTNVGHGEVAKIELQEVTLSIDGDPVTLKVPR